MMARRTASAWSLGLCLVAGAAQAAPKFAQLPDMTAMAKKADVTTAIAGITFPVNSVAGRKGDVILSHADLSDFTASVRALLPDLTPYALTSQLSGLDTVTARTAAIGALAIPTAGATTPPMETNAGSPGTSTASKYAPIDHSHPRLTRSAKFAVAANGALTGSWTPVLPGSAAPDMIYTATFASSGRVTCQNVPGGITVSGFSATCFVDAQVSLTTAIIALGVKVGPAFAPVGTSIDVTALPTSQ